MLRPRAARWCRCRPAPAASVGGTFHSVAHRFVRRHAASLGLPEGFACSTPGTPPTCSTWSARSTAARRARPPLPEEGHAARHLFTHGQHAADAVGGASPRRFRGASEHVEAIAALCRGYMARKRALGPARLRRPAAVLARAPPPTSVLGAALRGRVRPRAGRRVPGRERAPGRDRARRCARGEPRLTVVGDDIAGDLRLPGAERRSTCSSSAGASRDGDGRDPRAQLPLRPADPRHGQRGRRRSAGGVHTAALRATDRGGARPSCVRCRDEDAQAIAGVRARAGAPRGGHRAARAGGARCAPRTTATCSELELIRRGGSPS